MLFEMEHPYIDTLLTIEEDLLAMTESMLIYAFESELFTYAELAGIIKGQISQLDQLDDYLKNIANSKKIIGWQQFKQRYPLAYFRKLYQTYGITPVTILNEQAYPKALLSTYQPNLVLFCQGDIHLMKKRAISIVGSREMTAYGKGVIDQLLPVLAERTVIISGLARGVDTYAHQVAMAKGQTIAVIGTGLLTCYPSENRILQETISQDHLLISPLPSHAKIRRWHFPYRNLVIAGLSQGVVVVEAAEKSGSLITANYALQENRQVFAVPGSILSKLSSGTNSLIQSGAIPAIDGRAILEELFSNEAI